MLIAKVARSAPDLRGMSLAHLLARTEEDRHAQISHVLTASAVACSSGSYWRQFFGAASRQTNVSQHISAPVKLQGLRCHGQVLVRVAESRDWRPSGTGAECRRKDALWHVLRDSGGTDGSRAGAGSQIHRDTRRYTTAIKMVESGELIGREFIYPRQERCSSQVFQPTGADDEVQYDTVEQTKNADLSRLSPMDRNERQRERQASGIGADWRTQVGEVAPITIVIVAAPRR